MPFFVFVFHDLISLYLVKKSKIFLIKSCETTEGQPILTRLILNSTYCIVWIYKLFPLWVYATFRITKDFENKGLFLQSWSQTA